MWHKHEMRIGVQGGFTLMVYCKKCKKVFWWEMPPEINVENLRKINVDRTGSNLKVVKI